MSMLAQAAAPGPAPPQLRGAFHRPEATVLHSLLLFEPFECVLLSRGQPSVMANLAACVCCVLPYQDAEAELLAGLDDSALAGQAVSALHTQVCMGAQTGMHASCSVLHRT